MKTVGIVTLVALLFVVGAVKQNAIISGLKTFSHGFEHKPIQSERITATKKKVTAAKQVKTKVSEKAADVKLQKEVASIDKKLKGTKSRLSKVSGKLSESSKVMKKSNQTLQKLSRGTTGFNATKLEELDDLFIRGKISEKDYSAKLKKLLK